MYVTIKGNQYELATTLRVAYIIQGQNNHKSYLEIFEQIDKMTVEQQIGIVYAAFKACNPEAAKDINPTVFLNEYLDHYNLGDLMETVKNIIAGIMGKELADLAESPATSSEDTEEEDDQSVFTPGTDYSEEPLNVE